MPGIETEDRRSPGGAGGRCFPRRGERELKEDERPRRGGPEHIGSILARVFADLEKIYGGAVPLDLAESPDLSDPPALSGGEDGKPTD